MNKTKLILVACIVLSCTISYSQKLRALVTYEVTLDSEKYFSKLVNDQSISAISKQANIELVMNEKPMNFILTIRDNEASFESEFDLYEQRERDATTNRTGIMANTERIYYSNSNTKQFFFQSFWNQQVLVNINPKKWTLTKETKKINGYTCYKATSTIKTKQLYGMNFLSPITAWYTPEIETSFGIQEFHGLPGLTLQLIANREEGVVTFKATQINLNPTIDLAINKPESNNFISHQEYIELIDELNKKRF